MRAPHDAPDQWKLECHPGTRRKPVKPVKLIRHARSEPLVRISLSWLGFGASRRDSWFVDPTIRCISRSRCQPRRG